MADPFDVAPPQWLTNLVGRPVDMKSVGTAIGGALSRRFNPPSQNDKFQALARARMEAQIEQINAHAAEETANAALKRKLIQDKTRSDLQVAEHVALYGGDYKTMMESTIPPHYSGQAAKTLFDMQIAAGKYGMKVYEASEEAAFLKDLNNLTDKATDLGIAKEVNELRRTVKKNGITPEYEDQLGELKARANQQAITTKVDTAGQIAEAKSNKATDYPVPTVKQIEGKDFLFYRNYVPKELSKLTPAQREQAKLLEMQLKSVDRDAAKETDPTARASLEQRKTNIHKSILGLFGEQSTPKTSASGIPEAGEVRGGYRFKGGNPNDKNNWELEP